MYEMHFVFYINDNLKQNVLKKISNFDILIMNSIKKIKKSINNSIDSIMKIIEFMNDHSSQKNIEKFDIFKKFFFLKFKQFNAINI